MKLNTFLRLGRVSNLPTVWSNALAASVLTGCSDALTVLLSACTLSFFYLGGMWLNDAFDADVDRRQKKNRPVPSGEIGRAKVFAGGFILLGSGIGGSFALGYPVGLLGLGLAGAIILYDWLHKRTILSPLLMGAARFLGYWLAAQAAGGFEGPALISAIGLFAYIVGISYVAKYEEDDRLGRAWPLIVLTVPLLTFPLLTVPLAFTLERSISTILVIPFGLLLFAVTLYSLSLLVRRARGDVGRAVVTLISGISIYDATMLSAAGETALAVVAASCFLVALKLQRIAPGN